MAFTLLVILLSTATCNCVKIAGLKMDSATGAFSLTCTRKNVLRPSHSLFFGSWRTCTGHQSEQTLLFGMGPTGEPSQKGNSR